MYRKGNNNGGLKGEAPHKLQGWVWGAGRSPASRMDRGSVGFEENPPPQCGDQSALLPGPNGPMRSLPRMHQSGQLQPV